MKHKFTMRKPNRRGADSAAAGAANMSEETKHKRGKRAAGSKLTQTQLYTIADATLVLGDGDFTFSQGLVTHRGGGKGLVATSFDSASRVRAKYSNANACITRVKAAGGAVLHDVDATRLAATLPGSLPAFFRFIIFNFPHTGQQRVHLNRVLLQEFFESARGQLAARGEVHVTLKNRPPYSNWLVEDQARAAGFVLKARRRFDHRLFPGYHHRTTDPQAKKFEAELCTTYEFIVNRSKHPFIGGVPPRERMDVHTEAHCATSAPTSVASNVSAATTVPPSSADNRQRPSKVGKLGATPRSTPMRVSKSHKATATTGVRIVHHRSLTSTDRPKGPADAAKDAQQHQQQRHRQRLLSTSSWRPLHRPGVRGL